MDWTLWSSRNAYSDSEIATYFPMELNGLRAGKTKSTSFSRVILYLILPSDFNLGSITVSIINTLTSA